MVCGYRCNRAFFTAMIAGLTVADARRVKQEADAEQDAAQALLRLLTPSTAFSLPGSSVGRFSRSGDIQMQKKKKKQAEAHPAAELLPYKKIKGPHAEYPEWRRERIGPFPDQNLDGELPEKFHLEFNVVQNVKNFHFKIEPTLPRDGRIDGEYEIRSGETLDVELPLLNTPADNEFFIAGFTKDSDPAFVVTHPGAGRGYQPGRLIGPTSVEVACAGPGTGYLCVMFPDFMHFSTYYKITCRA